MVNVSNSGFSRRNENARRIFVFFFLLFSFNGFKNTAASCNVANGVTNRFGIFFFVLLLLFRVKRKYEKRQREIFVGPFPSALSSVVIVSRDNWSKGRAPSTIINDS